MIPYVRKQLILEQLEKNELVYVQDLKAVLPDISDSTIKRALRALAAEGQIKLLRGGAICKNSDLNSTGFDMPLDRKTTMNVERKKRIAKYAANMIQDGEVVFLDSSSTVIPLVNYLSDKKVTIVTSNIQIVRLNVSSDVKFILLGGEYNRQTGSVVGSLTESMLTSMFFDKAFIGGNGFSERGGVTTPDFRESSKKRIIVRNSTIAYFLMDATKANVTTLSKALDLNECNIITDEYCELLDKFKSSIVVP